MRERIGLASEKVQRLERIAAGLQERFGAGVLHRADSLPEAADLACISTQFPALDRVLGIGGIPRRRISEIAGVPTCGMNTLVLKIIASAQAEGDMAVYIDPGGWASPQPRRACWLCCRDRRVPFCFWPPANAETRQYHRTAASVWASRRNAGCTGGPTYAAGGRA